MNLQYITDENGQTTGIFIPIKEWNDLKSKFIGLDEHEEDIPGWHKQPVRERMERHKREPKHTLDFNSAIGEIEREL